MIFDRTDRERKWVQRQAAKGIAPWTNPDYAQAWLHDFAAGERNHPDWDRRYRMAHSPAPQPAAPDPRPDPLRCPQCGQTPCIGYLHHAFAVLHPDDPLVRAEQGSRAYKEMVASLRREFSQ